MVAVHLYNEETETRIATLELAAVPAIGTEVMLDTRDWERWAVVGVRYWPSNGLTDIEPSVWVYVRYGGDLD